MRQAVSIKPGFPAFYLLTGLKHSRLYAAASPEAFCFGDGEQTYASLLAHLQTGGSQADINTFVILTCKAILELLKR
jgi:hypothetical protein